MPRPFLTADWRHLVMLNYEIDPAILQPYLPRGLELDTFQGRHFVSIVGFMFHKTKVLGLPIPFHRRFAEVNLRFYVTRTIGNGLRRGVVFIREVAPRRAVCFLARRIYNEAYVYCHMHDELVMPDDGVGRVSYSWNLSGGEMKVAAEFEGQPMPLVAGSLEQFIAEHYWGYSRQRDGGTKEYHVAHVPWNVWNAKTSRLTGDPIGFYGSEFTGVFDREPVSAFVADGSPVAVYPGCRLFV